MSDRNPLSGIAVEHALDPAALKAFAHPLRLQIYRFLTDRGQATATGVAEHLGESTGQTSYHLRQLARHGVIEEVADMGSGRERWWRPASFSMRDRELLTRPDTAPAAAMVLAEMARERAETLQAWLLDDRLLDDHSTAEWVEASLVQTTSTVLSRDELAVLNKEVQDVIARHLEGKDDRQSLVGTPAPDGSEYRRVRLHYDGFPLATGD